MSRHGTRMLRGVSPEESRLTCSRHEAHARFQRIEAEHRTIHVAKFGSIARHCALDPRQLYVSLGPNVTSLAAVQERSRNRERAQQDT